MLFEKKIGQCLREIQELEKIFCEAQKKEILPISFFSSSIDILYRLKTEVYEIEETQLKIIQEHLNQKRDDWFDRNEIKLPEQSMKPEAPEKQEILEIKVTPEVKTISEDKTTPAVNIFADTISRKIIGEDFRKSLSLNDRFRFQRDLFQENANEMNQAFAQLDTFHSLNEALGFLNEKYDIPWDCDSGIVLKELLHNRFA